MSERVRRRRASFRCGQMPVRREAANVLPIVVGIRRSVQLVSTLGSVVPPAGVSAERTQRHIYLMWLRGGSVYEYDRR
jgi:hypothetical protein